MLSNVILINIFLSFLNIVLKFYLNYFLANNYDEADLIRYFTLIDIITIFSMITVGFKDTLVRTVGALGESFGLYFFKGIPWFLIIFFIIFIPIIFFLVTNFNIVTFNYDLLIIEIMTLFFILNLIMTHFLLAYRKYKPVSYFEFLKGFIFIAIFFLLIIFFEENNPFNFLVLSFIFSNLIIFLWLLPKVVSIHKYASFKNKVKPYLISKKKKKIIFSSFSFSSFEYICSSLIIYSSSLFMLFFYGQENVGDLQVVARPIYLALITVFSFPIFRFLFPEFVKLLNSKDFNKIKIIKRKLNIAIFFGSMVLIAISWNFSMDFVLFLFPNEYLNSYKFLNIMTLSVPFVIYTSVLFSLIKSHEHFIGAFFIRFIGVIFFILSIIILHSLEYDEISIAYAIVISSFTMFLSAYVYEKRIRVY